MAGHTDRGGAGIEPRTSRFLLGNGAKTVRPVTILLATAIVVTASSALQAAIGDRVPERAGRSDAPGADASLAPVAPADGELARLIRAYERRVLEHTTPSDHRILGELYLERARVSGDVADLGRAERALRQALELYPTDPDARVLLARVRYSSHEFDGALALAEDVVAEDPDRLDALLVAGDARLALGDLADAARVYASLAGALPDAPEVLVRLARLSFLRGDAEEARRLADRAERGARAMGATGASLAFYRSFQGQIAFDGGRYREAAAHHRAALDAASRWYVAQGGLARAVAARGRVDRAIALYRQAIAAVPDPMFVAALGDLYRIQGRERHAAREYATVEAIASLAGVNRQVYNRPYALFLADHERNPVLAVRLAENELRIRRDVHGWDADAWALFAAGRYEGARRASDRALALGTPDATLWYHAGMISAALGERERGIEELGRALELSPAFDPIQAERARTTLTELEGTTR